MRTPETIYKRALDEFDDAVKHYKLTCDRIKDGKETEFSANATLNSLISLAWRVKEAACLREPAPIPPRPAVSKKRKEVNEETQA